jgi:hypothetical protein
MINDAIMLASLLSRVMCLLCMLAIKMINSNLCAAHKKRGGADVLSEKRRGAAESKHPLLFNRAENQPNLGNLNNNMNV